LKPAARCSACWRGYVCRYVVSFDQLWLDHLSIGLSRSEQLKINSGTQSLTLFGIQAKHAKGGPIGSIFDADFEDMKHRIPYTGGLLLARDFVKDLYVHTGFHPAWKYRAVHELIFRRGELTQSFDRSLQIAEFRNEISESPLTPGQDATRTEIKDWVGKCFSQQYSW
jgi:hypothetical protein